MFRTATQGRPLPEPTTGTVRLMIVPELAEIYEQHLRYVWRCLRSLGVSDCDLDDAIQDLFLVVQKKLPEFDGGVSPKTWLYAIAIRIARQYKERSARARRRNESGEERIHSVAAPSDIEADTERKQRLDLARVALEALDDDKREVFVFSQIEQLSASEISDITGLPVNTVYSRLRAARSVFAAEIERLLTVHGRSK